MLAPFRLAAAASALVAAAPAAATSTTYAFTKESQVEYVLVHPAHTIHGTTASLIGKVTWAGDRLVTPLKVKVPVATFKSGNANRDNNAVLTLGAAKWPSAELEVTRFDQASKAGEGAGVKVAGTAVGTLKLHGQTRAVSIPLTATIAPDRLVVDAAFTISLTAYGIERPALVFVPTEDEVKVTVHGVAAAAN